MWDPNWIIEATYKANQLSYMATAQAVFNVDWLGRQ